MSKLEVIPSKEIQQKLQRQIADSRKVSAEILKAKSNIELTTAFSWLNRGLDSLILQNNVKLNAPGPPDQIITISKRSTEPDAILMLREIGNTLNKPDAAGQTIFHHLAIKLQALKDEARYRQHNITRDNEFKTMNSTELNEMIFHIESNMIPLYVQDYGMDPMVRDTHGETPLDYCPGLRQNVMQNLFDAKTFNQAKIPDIDNRNIKNVGVQNLDNQEALARKIIGIRNSNTNLIDKRIEGLEGKYRELERKAIRRNEIITDDIFSDVPREEPVERKKIITYEEYKAAEKEVEASQAERQNKDFIASSAEADEILRKSKNQDVNLALKNLEDYRNKLHNRHDTLSYNKWVELNKLTTDLNKPENKDDNNKRLELMEKFFNSSRHYKKHHINLERSIRGETGASTAQKLLNALYFRSRIQNSRSENCREYIGCPTASRR